ncbi:MAG TPA: cob(I)yrinic acid a,c-diamide adenosyltransferase [Candidatus Woesebacteria bacterium]|nr:cob(I)yrinic acid a,c-diamide adenosyltransferase [Candidatus Woesebacteria bacterium]
MSIYTKTGDTGQTALFGGKRVWKYDSQVEAYGITDEASSYIGLALESVNQDSDKKLLSDIQYELYNIMGYLSGAPLQKNTMEQHIIFMEKTIDQIDKTLPKLTRFVLPQGSESTARLHIARSKVRTAERRVIEFIEQKKEQSKDDKLIIQYLNRLSDCLFMLARKYTPEDIET